jgi:hypothetical protein
VRITSIKIFTFVVNLCYLIEVSYSLSTNFDFSLREYLVPENFGVGINFSYFLSGYEDSDFVVKPFIGNGVVEIFNPQKNEWVGNFSPEEFLPKISETMLVRVRDLNIVKTYLWFEIEGIKDGNTYFTPKKIIWGESVYDGYVEGINYSISNYGNTVKENDNLGTEVKETSASADIISQDFIKKIPREFYLYFSIGTFSIFTVLSFLYQRPRNKREVIQSISEDFKKLDSRNINDDSHLRSIIGPWRCNKTIDSRK